jgi:hypothetical protein
MSKKKETKLKKLYINELTEEQYSEITPKEKELYLTPDTTEQDIASAIKDHNSNPLSHADIRALTDTFIHEQGVASAVWTVQHNLNKYPSVTVVDSSGNELITEIEYVDTNTVQITMNGASKGRAYLN